MIFIIILLLFGYRSRYSILLYQHIFNHFNQIQYTFNKKDDIAILGGGISGLSIAYFLQDTHNIINLYEASDSISGNIKNYDSHCPVFMSCFDLPRSKHISYLMEKLNLKATKVMCWKNITLKTKINNKLNIFKIPNYNYLLLRFFQNPFLFYKLINAYSSINYFTSKSNFEFSQLLCYILNHSKGSYYSIQNGQNFKLIEKLRLRLRRKTSIHYNNKIIKLQSINHNIQCVFSNHKVSTHQKIIIAFQPHYILKIISPDTNHNELKRIWLISQCFYEQKAFSCFHTDIKLCDSNSGLTYQEVEFKGLKHYILTINPRVFYNTNKVSKDKRITIWYEDINMVKIEKNQILQTKECTISLLKKDKYQQFINLSKELKYHKQIFLASSYFSFSKWADDGINIASRYRF